MKKYSKKIIFVLVFLAVFVAATSLTFGKYIYNSAWNYYLTSKGFYFKSDLLDINSRTNSILKWDGSNVIFNIKNSQNDELISEYDITYKVSCEVLGDETDYISCKLNGADSDEFTGNLVSLSKCLNKKDDIDVSSYSKAECEINGYEWKEDVANKENYFNLELTDSTKSIDEVTVKIVAESIIPYHEILEGVFILNRVAGKEEEIVVNYESHSEYDELSIINTTETNKCLEITFESNDYSIDPNEISYLDYKTDDSKKINKIDIKIPRKNSGIYKFYKINQEKVYSEDNIKILEKECEN